MGITRKVLSLGARKQNRRIAEQTNALEQQHEEMVALQRQALEQQSRTHQPVRSPGWYPDTEQTGFVRWWDGSTWTQKVRPA